MTDYRYNLNEVYLYETLAATFIICFIKGQLIEEKYMLLAF